MSRRLKIALDVVAAPHPGRMGDDDDSNETAEPRSDGNEPDPRDYQGGVAPDDVEEGDPLLRTSRRRRTRTRKLRPLSIGSLDGTVRPRAS
jgi:hypothetical protein